MGLVMASMIFHNAYVFVPIVVMFVSGCRCGSNRQEAAKLQAKTVNLYIWSDYTSSEVLRRFESSTGMKVQESNFSSNEELLAKLQAGATGYDVIIPSDYMVIAMASLGLLSELDLSKIPNAQRIDARLLKQSYDPENKVSLPYSWGVSGIAFHEGKTGPISSWEDLIKNNTLRERWSFLDDSREVIAAGLKMHGHSINSVDPKELEQAKQRIIELKRSVKAFTSTPMSALLSGELLAAHMYSNEAFMAHERSEGKIQFAFPKEGGVRNIDNFAIPKTARNVEGAHQLINFLLHPENHADFVNRLHAGPVLTDMHTYLSKSMLTNPLISNSDAILSKSEMLRDLGDHMVVFDRIWTEIKAAR